ncbi:2-hydroxy-6-ketonona-2,4-dienedioic acid hydrolase [Mycobacterium marinum]|uniref:alpha/beta fold hydrolase n=1 Tax=Mycobacterium marinum TaxID=1781 RepID=UPI0021C4BF52|nr:alpha/beta hydrolase [Mycobacterium marinum]GJO03855.1 2-hydroxy-6-ketonona-2,4-dienedioic acid hydrolase [Mycobacterium marinum]GJO06539.1 2-hydroxy-6-ketonona-2,4-dienedioic acid hydrolase [Mycobacterium marinum]GJO13997.1 2-hydroxy-6-ketonona-2,4-dienedioic acid hydrolase [Mycobacterium marinum]GJO15387.1 2-hydroxy-6-ketonona-2,4-dienedioic acid hydrolase [Mycobacterium marinum]GJO16843.1 2-hydroxy-6-ketonona-2,4-dienedioic acid hydrolase [Mycobacterium marinum]
MTDFESVWSDLQGVTFEQGYLTIAQGVRTRYLRAGEPDRPLLMLLHGSGGHAEAYVRNLAAHAEHFWTWAIDMLGHGYTDKPGHPLEIRHYVEHLMAVLRAIGAQRASISGESLGGWVAARAAVYHPEAVERLVLNTAGGSQADPEVMARIVTLSMAAAENPTWETVQARIKWLMADKSKDYDDLVASRQRIYRQPGFVAAMRDIMALQDPQIRARNLLGPAEYGAIKAPTLVLWTSHDPTADVTEGRRIASMIPGARFEVMSGCGHWPQYEDAKSFNRRHLDFLMGH